MSNSSEEIISRSARGLFSKIANSLTNSDPLATSGRKVTNQYNWVFTFQRKKKFQSKIAH